MKRMTILLAAICALTAGANAQSLEKLSFLEGGWRGGDDNFVFEEVWSSADGGVMTAMARGVRDGALVVLEYIVIEETEGAPIMRFKHFNADYSVWEGEEEQAIVLQLTEIDENHAVFSAPTSDGDVRAITYGLDDDGRMTVDVVLLENGEKGGFSLVFEKVSD
ncbi:MAG: DUF6265 family protein [Pseudomonadota bacterium]